MAKEKTETARDDENFPEAEGVEEWEDAQSETVNESVIAADEQYQGNADPKLQEQLDDRIALAAAPHREVTNEEHVEPDELIQVEVGPDDNEDGASEDLPQEVLVKELAESGQLFEKGGPLPNGELSDGADGMFLAERSKQTGEKLF